MAVDTTANPFVAIFSPSGGPAQAATVLQGFLGDATGNKKRIYFSVDLRHYAEFAENAVLHRTKISQADHPLGLEIDTVWLKAEAEITYVPNPPPTGWSQPGGSGGLPAPYGGGYWAGAYGPYGGGTWAGAIGPYGGGWWAG